MTTKPKAFPSCAWNHGIDRRSLMIGAAATALSAGSGFGAAQSSALAGTPKQGGLFRIGLGSGSTTESLDPAESNSGSTISNGYCIRNSLTEIGSDDSLVAELAESWDVSRDVKTWTFKLRQGVEFHNGKSFEAADVVASLNHHRGENSKSGAKALMESVADIRADGKHTVVIELSTGNADLPTLMTDYHFLIMPSDGEGGVDWSSGVGTGGYILESFEPGVRSQFRRNPNYWKTDAAYFDEVEILNLPDTTARASAATSGRADAIDKVDLKTADLLEQAADVVVEDIPSNQFQVFAMDTSQAPFDNNDVRMALKLAIDREDVLTKIMRGRGALGNDHPIGPRMPYFAADIPQRAYDPDMARHHLKRAGHDVLTVPLHVANTPFPGAVDMGTLYKEHARKAGIEINLVREPEDGFWSKVWMNKPFFVSNWGARPIPDMILSIAYLSNAPWNETRWGTETLDKLITAARVELDHTKRAEMYREIQMLIRDNGGSIIPTFSGLIFARRSNVTHGPSVASNWELDGYKAPERWWFA